MTADERKLILGSLLSYGYDLFIPLTNISNELVLEKDERLLRTILVPHSIYRQQPIVRLVDISPYKYDAVLSCLLHRRTVFFVPQEELDRTYVPLVERYELKITDSMFESARVTLEKERARFERNLSIEAESTVEFYRNVMKGL